MINFHLTGRIIDKRIDKIILKNKPLLFKFMACFQLYCLFTQYADHRGPQSREKKKTMVFSSALEFTGHPLSVCLALPLSPLPFIPLCCHGADWAGYKQWCNHPESQLSPRMFFLSLWCVPLCSSHAGISTNKAPQNCDGNLQDRFCVCLFVFMLLLRRDQLV